MSRTKIVQGYNQNYDILNYKLKTIFQIIKSINLDIINIVFREIYDKITILLHYPTFKDSDFYILYNLKSKINVVNLIVHPHKIYSRNMDRIIIWGDYIQTINFNNRFLLKYTPDSFLQPDIKICIELYDYILVLLNKINSDNFMGFGEDMCNIANYVKKQAYCFLHCKETMNIGINDSCKATLDINEWSENKTSNVLITTPGRNGFKKGEIKIIQNMDFKYIIYIGCKLKTISKDFLKFNKNFSLLESKQFEMFNKNQVEYISTVQVWCKPTFISIGNNCSIAYHLNNISYPFDWCNSPNLQIINDLLNNNFNILFNKFEFYKKKCSNTHFYEKTRLFETMDVQCLKIGENSIEFPHDFRNKYSFDSEFDIFKEKIKRRIDRINKYDFKIFVRYESKPQKLTNELMNNLLQYCNKLILIIPFNKIHKINITKFENIHIIKDIYLDQHFSWKREGLRDIIRDILSLKLSG